MNKEESSAEDGIPAIQYETIFAEWQAGKSLREIAERRGLKIATVMRILKEQQKSIIQKGK